MSKPSIELNALLPNASVPRFEPLACDGESRSENDLLVDRWDRWEQRGEDRTRQTSSYCIHITLPGRTS